MFNHLPPHIVFQEVPDEVSLAFIITGCPLKCVGCHSQDTWDSSLGVPLTNELFSEYLEKYKGLITCVLFFGGEWQSQYLIEKLCIAKSAHLKTCLYTGMEKLPQRLLKHLDFAKYGPWREECGGLDSKETNQTLINLSSGECLNHKFVITTS